MDATSADGVAVVDRHETQEHAASEVPVGFGQHGDGRLRPPGDGSLDAAELAIVRQCHRPPLLRRPAIEELGQRELEEGQCGGLIDHVGDELVDEPRLHLDPHAGGRLSDRVGDLGGRHPDDRDRPVLDELAELGIPERSIEEVGAQRRCDPQPDAFVGDGVGEAVEERATEVLVGHQREQLLELVDHEEERLPLWHRVADEPTEPIVAVAPGARACIPGGRDRAQRSVQRGEGVGAGHHRRVEPALGTVEGP